MPKRRHADDRFAAGETTNDELESGYPDTRKTADRSIRAIETMVWHLYSDSAVHTLQGAHAPSAEGRALLRRCIAFLESDVEYEWADDDFISTSHAELNALRASGAFEWWPFPSDQR